MEKYDLLLKNGEVIDPATGIHGMYDVAIANGKIALVGNVLETDARKVIDVSGKIVTPGLIDIHGHYTRGIFNYINPDKTCLPNGVTTSVDAGGLNWDQCTEIQGRILEDVHTRLYCLLRVRKPDVQISDDIFEWVTQHNRLVLGCKITIGQDTRVLDAIPLLEKGLQVAEKAGTRLVVHVGCSPVPLSRILDRLRPGDIVAHIFHGEGHNILDWEHNVRPEVWAARQRGVLFDVAHCIVYFDSRLARAAIEQGFLPDTISTDMSVLPFRIGDRNEVYSLPEVMSICIGMGMSLEQVIACTTVKAAAAIGKSGELGSLSPGTPADVSVFELKEGDFSFVTGFFREDRMEVRLKRILAPYMTVFSGQILEPENETPQQSK